MDRFTISIFGSKIFFEITKEIKLFSKFKVKYYEDLNLCLNNIEKEKKIVVFFVNKDNLALFKNIKTNDLPFLFITSVNYNINYHHHDFNEYLNKPFTIFDFEKKIISLIARDEYKKNSLIKLNNYVIDKNERKISNHEKSLKLSEKEINFLVLFSKINEPINKKLLLKKVWNYSDDSETHTVETHIHRLRKKILDKFGDNDFIKNNHKGYYI